MWIVNGVSQLCFLAEKMERKGQNNVADGSQENEKGKRKSKFVFVNLKKLIGEERHNNLVAVIKS